MNVQSFRVGGSLIGVNAINGVVADQIADSFNAANTMKDCPLKTAILHLNKETAESVINKLVDDPSKQEKATNRLQSFTAAAKETPPDVEQLRVSATGLLEAASWVAGMVNPIATALRGVFNALGLTMPG